MTEQRLEDSQLPHSHCLASRPACESLTHQPMSLEHNRSQYKGKARMSLMDEVNQAAAAAAIPPDIVIEQALENWLDDQRSSGPSS